MPFRKLNLFLSSGTKMRGTYSAGSVRNGYVTGVRWTRLAVSSGSNRVGASHSFVWGSFPKSCVLQNAGRRTKPRNSVIMGIIRHHQNPFRMARNGVHTESVSCFRFNGDYTNAHRRYVELCLNTPIRRKRKFRINICLCYVIIIKMATIRSYVHYSCGI
jgi:hypothetical protein